MSLLKGGKSPHKKKKLLPKLRFVQETLPHMDIENKEEKEAKEDTEGKESAQLSPIYSKKKTLFKGRKGKPSKTVTLNSIKIIEPEDVEEEIKEEVSTNIDQNKLSPMGHPSSFEEEQTVMVPDAPEQVLSQHDIETLRSQEKVKIHDELAELKQEEEHKIKQEIEEFRRTQLSHIEQEKKTHLDQGYQDGLEKGRQEGLVELRSKVEELGTVINDAKQVQDTMLKSSEKDILSIALTAAEKIVQNEITANKSTCVGIVKEALQKITDKDKVIIKTNPSEINLLKENFVTLQNLIPDIKQLELEEDPRIQPGGCIIETKLGFVDSSISTKLDSIKKALFDAYDQRMEENSF